MGLLFIREGLARLVVMSQGTSCVRTFVGTHLSVFVVMTLYTVTLLSSILLIPIIIFLNCYTVHSSLNQNLTSKMNIIPVPLSHLCQVSRIQNQGFSELHIDPYCANVRLLSAFSSWVCCQHSVAPYNPPLKKQRIVVI